MVLVISSRKDVEVFILFFKIFFLYLLYIYKSYSAAFNIWVSKYVNILT